MRKNLNGLLSFALILITMFACCNKVFAFSKGQTFERYETGDNASSQSKLTDYYYVGSTKYSASLYKHSGYETKNVGNKYDFYCLDGGLQAYNNNGKTTLVVDSILSGTNPIDATILYIMNAEGYDYYSKLAAIRSFIPFTKYAKFELVASKNTSDTNKKAGLLYSYINSGMKYLSKLPKDQVEAVLGVKNNDYSTLYTLLKKNGIESANYFKEVYSTSSVNGVYDKYHLNDAVAVNKNAEKLLAEAIKYAAGVDPNSKLSKRVEVSKAGLNDVVSEELGASNNADNMVTREIELFVNFYGFETYRLDNEVVTINTNLTTDSAHQNQVRIEKMIYSVVSKDGKEVWNEFNSNTNFADVVKNDEATIRIKIKVSGEIYKKDQFTISLTVDPSYKLMGELSGAFLKPTGRTGSKDNQRFFVGEGSLKNPSPDNVSETFKFNWTTEEKKPVCDEKPDTNDITTYRNWINECCRPRTGKTDEFSIQNSCETAKSKNDTDGINKWCSLYDNYCSVCDTKFNIDSTCSEFSDGEFENDRKGSISGPENVKLCVIDETKEGKENNSDRLLTKDNLVKPYDSSKDTGNKYCSVYCKEDFDFDIPSGRYTINGQHFTLGMNINATKTCYSGTINYQQFEQDYNLYYNDALSKKGTSEFAAAQKKLDKAIADINACAAGWSNDYSYDPKINFTYDEEEYIDMLPNKVLEFVREGESNSKVSEVWLCQGTDINNEYTSCTNGKAYTNIQDALTTKAYIDAKGNASTISVPNNISYAKKAITDGGIYTPERVFYTKASTGIISTNKNDCKGDKNCLSTYTLITDSKFAKEKGLDSTGTIPVRLSDGRGIYNYKFEFDNIGEFYNKIDKTETKNNREDLGRLISLNNVSEKNPLINQLNTAFKGIYSCVYVVNCPECKVSCVDDPENGILCSLPTCNGGDCELSCEGLGCAYDSDHGILYTVHQTSLLDFTKNRNSGLNWDKDKNIKAAAAIDEIESKGEDIYKEPEYEFEITPAVITELRKYNSENDSYLNDSMYCKNYSDRLKDLGASSSTIEKAKENDYLICDSEVLTKLSKDAKVKASLDGRKKYEGFLNSEYCKNNVCALVGAVGPAWK